MSAPKVEVHVIELFVSCHHWNYVLGSLQRGLDSEDGWHKVHLHRIDEPEYVPTDENVILLRIEVLAASSKNWFWKTQQILFEDERIEYAML